MNIPTKSPLPFANKTVEAYHLSHDFVPSHSKQRRLVGQSILTPAVDLDAYRFRALIDWIEFRVHFSRATQAQHVQQVLRQHLDRDSHIAPENPGEGNTFASCLIRVQEPASLALIVRIYRHLVCTFGEAAGSRVTAIEISVDAYPRQPSDEARMSLLGALQRAIWTDRDIWSNPNSRPRMSFGRGKEATIRLSPEPEMDDTSLSRAVPENHAVPFVDATMYLGARDTDTAMVRIMDKVKDRQRPDGTFDTLSDGRKRVRIEVTLKGIELVLIGITDVPSLRHMKITSIKKRYFQFKLPTFSQRSPIRSTGDVIRNTKEVWRARTYLRTGMTGLMTMDAASDAFRRSKLPEMKRTMRLMNQPAPRVWSGRRLAPANVVWADMNRKVDVAFRQMEKRERTAWRRR